jgi:hypothetical protein
VAIPHRLHHVWLGPRPVPEPWARRWRRRHPGWSYRLWREPDIEPILPPGFRRAWDHFLATSRWHGASDIARVAILLREGGVYVDIDSEPVRAFDDAPFMAGTFFAGLELGTPDAVERVTNGVIGAEPDHPVLRRHAQLIEAAEVVDPPWKTVGGGFLTQALLELRDLPGVTILPVRTFYPEDKNGRPNPGRETVYTRHYFATTHSLYPYDQESWENLARRRRGEPIVPSPSVRLRAAARNAARWVAQRSRSAAKGLLRRTRRGFRRVVPKSVRRVARDVIRGPAKPD